MESTVFYSKVQSEIDIIKSDSLSTEQKRFINALNKELYPVAYAGYIPYLKFPFYEFRCYSECHPLIKAVKFETTYLFKPTVKRLAKEYLKKDDIDSIFHINEKGIQVKMDSIYS